MKIPTVHLNGSGADSLLKQFRAVGEAVHSAIEALTAAAPHGRDYYVQGGDAFAEAQAEHLERLAALQKILKDYQTLAIDVSNQRAGRYTR